MTNDIEKLNKKMIKLRAEIAMIQTSLSIARKSTDARQLNRAEMLNRQLEKKQKEYSSVEEQFYNHLSPEGDYLYNKYRK